MLGSVLGADACLQGLWDPDMNRARPSARSWRHSLTLDSRKELLGHGLKVEQIVTVGNCAHVRSKERPEILRVCRAEIVDCKPGGLEPSSWQSDKLESKKLSHCIFAHCLLVRGNEKSLASLDKSLGSRRQIRHVASSWERGVICAVPAWT